MAGGRQKDMKKDKEGWREKELKHAFERWLYFGRHEYNMEFFMIRVESNKLRFEAFIYTICCVLFSIKR